MKIQKTYKFIARTSALLSVGLSAILSTTVYAAPGVSMDLAYEQRSGADRVYVANPDQDSVTVVNAGNGNRIAEINVGDEPRSVALDGNGNLWVVNKNSASISIINTNSLSVTNTIPGPYGSRPHGIVIDTDNDLAYIVLEATGDVLKLNSINASLIAQTFVGLHARSISISDDGSRIYMPRFITRPVARESGTNPANGGGQVAVLNTNNLSGNAVINIPYNNAASGGDTNSNTRGVPNYLRALAISPDGSRGFLPAKIDNIHRGTMRDRQRREHNMLTRGIMSQINLNNNTEILSNRVEFRNNSNPTAAAYSPGGNYVYAVHEGSRAFEVINAGNGNIVFESTLGFAPRGIVVSTDGNRAYVHNWLSRSLSIIDTSRHMSGSGTNAPVVNTVNLISREALNATVLRGKRIFHDSADPRLSGNRYISCASCHDEGRQDGRVWDFSDVGEGLRNTTAMTGRGDMENGLVHWAANFDEIQDFEHAFREIFGGTGLMSNAAFRATATPIDPSGMKTGRSGDLDALAAFIDTLDFHGVSPYRQQNGSLTAAGVRGRRVFESASCATCHSGDDFTDSPAGGSYDIGTVDDQTGGRFGQPLINGGLDTPTLKGLWYTSPYLHDGSAATVADAIRAHTDRMPVATNTFSSSEISDLATYLLQIDDNEPAPDDPTVPPATPDTFSNFANIAIDGNMNDWSNSTRLFNDPRDSTGGANQLDYQTVWMANDNQTLYLRYRNHRPNNARLTWGYGQAIDVNGAAIGYRAQGNLIPIGVDYLVEEESLYRYTGNGVSWSWAWVGRLPIEFNGRNAELSIPRSMLGNPSSMDMFFYADNGAIGGTEIDFIPNSAPNTGALLQERFIRYEFARNNGRRNIVTSREPQPQNDDGVVYSNPVASISVDGKSGEWENLSLFPIDPHDVEGDTDSIDFVQGGVAHNDTSLFLGWFNDGPAKVTWGNAVLVDTDLNVTSGFQGFLNDSPIGIDYLIEEQSVYRYSGNGNSWSWEWVGAAKAVASGSTVEIQVPLETLGNPTTLDMFYYGDSSAVGGTGIDFYPDGAQNVNADISARRFRYTRDTALASSVGEVLNRNVSNKISGGAASGSPWLLLIISLFPGLRRRTCAHPGNTPVATQRKSVLAMSAVLTLIMTGCGGGGSVNGEAPAVEGQAGSTPRTSLTFAAGNVHDRPGVGVLKSTLGDKADGSLNFDDLQIRVFAPKCAGCHIGGGVSQPSLFDFTTADASYATLVNKPSTASPGSILVTPGNSVASYLMKSLNGTQAVGSRMPMRSSPLSEQDLRSISEWIDRGADR